MSHKNTGPVARIYSNLTSRGVDFRYGWSTHRDKGGIVVGMSPQELTDVVLDIIRKEMRDDGVQTGEDGKSDSTLNEVPRQAKSRHSGLRGGRGGDFFELFKSLITPPREEDGEIRAIRGVVVEAEAKKRNKWKELEQDEIDELIKWRDAQQNKWASGFLASNRMNGSAARPRYAQ
ncbi:hypothetical protein GQ44DRAFT_718176 [Phaeosphaeriaceae sp. PMI808]|nr:hypothetical protein GQ44DRAFT_718176 [Phaeosphaeriaceae sp. PMI808]